MSRDMRDISPGTYVLNPDTLAHLSSNAGAAERGWFGRMRALRRRQGHAQSNVERLRIAAARGVGARARVRSAPARLEEEIVVAGRQHANCSPGPLNEIGGSKSYGVRRCTGEYRGCACACDDGVRD